MSVTSWFLVSSSGTRHRLPREMIFVGREDCELMLQSRSVDKQHAVINYNPATDEHLVKDLGSLNGTFVNDLRIPDQTYITLKLSDVVRFGYDSHVYVLERSQHKVPEEALKHEKYTSQLQMGMRASESKRQEIMEERAKLERSERKSLTEPPVPRPTPLYGQPSWWGEEDAGNLSLHVEGRRPDDSHPDLPKEMALAADGKLNGALPDYRDLQGKSSSSYPYHREPSYFEIPTKEFQTIPAPLPASALPNLHQQQQLQPPPPPTATSHGKPQAAELNEIPTKDTDCGALPLSSPTATPPVVQSHASFTIEFDECAPGKIKIKDHVTKFSSRPRGKTHSSAKPLVSTPTEVMSAESKVADWLVHTDVSMMRRRPPAEDVYSTKSDLAMNIKTLRGHHHDDGTQSDSEDPVLKGKHSKSHHSIQSQDSVPSHMSMAASEPLPSSHPPGHLSPPHLAPPSPVAAQTLVCLSPVQQETPSPDQGRCLAPPVEPPSQQAFVIEFFDDNPRKKRSQSFTANPDSYSALRAKLERRKAAGGGGHSGERPASVHGHPPPTQQITVPLKGPHPSGPQRSSSLKREKTCEDPPSSGSHTSSPPGPTSRPGQRPFGSAGRKSRLAQEFAAEFLKETTATPASPPPMSAPPVMTAACPSQALLPSPGDLSGPTSMSYPSSPSPCTASYPSHHPPPPTTARSPPISQGVAIPIPVSSHPVETVQAPASVSMSESFSLSTSISISGMDPRTSRTVRTEEEDSLSDAGTYTIETESQDKEVEEARSMIDQVFGVLDSPEYSGPTLGVTRPVIEDGKEEHPITHSPADLASATIQGLNIPKHSPDPSQTQAQASQSSPKWVSRWASLADSYTEPGAPGTSPQTETDKEGRMPHSMMLSQSLDISDVEGGQGSRIRRLLPQVPQGDKSDGPTPCVLIRHDPYLECEFPERASGTPSQGDSSQRLRVQDDVDPDSLSDTSRSEDGSILERRNRRNGAAGAPLVSPGECAGAPWGTNQESVVQTPKSTCFYIGSDDGSQGRPEPSRSPLSSQSERDHSPRTPPTTVLIRHLSGHEPRRTSVKPNSSAPNLQTHERDAPSTKDGVAAVVSGQFVRQESFTKERPTDDVQVKRLPHISSHPTLRDLERAEIDHDPQAFLQQEADRVFSSPEEKRSDRGSKRGEDSMSGESDVDTASTVSMVSSHNAPVTLPKSRSVGSGTQRERLSGQDKGRQPTARERLSEKRRSHTTATESSSKAEGPRRVQIRRSTGNRGSLDLSDGQQGHGQNHWADAGAASSSDHESGSRAAARKRLSAPPLKDETPSKANNKITPQVLTRSNSLSAPRPTRASMLRRARLGEASDNEGAETASQSSDHGRNPADGKKLSRLDILAMPRKRTGSFTAPSDNESTSARTGQSARSSELSGGNGSRKTTPGDVKQGASKTAAATAKLPSARTRSSTTKHTNAAGARRRQKGSDYSSTSEEEQEVSSGSQKHKRSHTSTSTQTPQALKVAPTRSKSISLDAEIEEEAQNEHFQNWSTHSAEIARLSQDLAKDLAILAREIHDVAGDGDSQSSGMGTTTSPGSAANTPASTIAREELVQHIPEASLNYQKVPPGSLSPIEQDSNMNEQDSKRRPWNREEVILDNLMLNPVSQLSQAIRENTEQLTKKMKVMFRNKTEVWEEIEAKINAENEVPILKTSNKEISSILQELRRVQRQLEVINTIVEPSGSPKMAAATASPSGGTPRHAPRTKPSSQARQTGPSSTHNANERSRRTTR